MYYLIDVILLAAIPFICKGQDVILTTLNTCYNVNDVMTLEAEYNGTTSVVGVIWTITGGATSMIIDASNCLPFSIPTGFPSGRMSYVCSSAPKYRLTVQTLESADFVKTWGVDFSLSTGSTSSGTQQQIVAKCETVNENDTGFPAWKIGVISLACAIGVFILVSAFCFCTKWFCKLKVQEYYCSITTELNGGSQLLDTVYLTFGSICKQKIRLSVGIYGQKVTEVYKRKDRCNISKLMDLWIVIYKTAMGCNDNKPDCAKVLIYSIDQNSVKEFKNSNEHNSVANMEKQRIRLTLAQTQECVTPCCIQVTVIEKTTAETGTFEVVIGFSLGEMPNEIVLLHGIKLNETSEQIFYLPLCPGVNNHFDTVEIGVFRDNTNIHKVLPNLYFEQVLVSINKDEDAMSNGRMQLETMNRENPYQRIVLFKGRMHSLEKNTTLKLTLK